MDANQVIAALDIPPGYSLKPVGRCHAEELANTLRDADREELRKLYGIEPRQAILDSVESSYWCLAFFDPAGKLICIGGVSGKPEDGLGLPWLLATNRIEANRWAFLSISRQLVAQMRAEFKCLWNGVDIENRAAIRWLGWLGFMFDPVPVTTAAGGTAQVFIMEDA